MNFLNTFFKKTMPLILILLFSFGLMAQQESKTYVKTTENNTTYKVAGWESHIAYNPYNYTWYSWEEPVVKKMKTKSTKMIPISEFDRPPLFDAACLTKEEMFECSNNKVQEYVANHDFDYPDRAQTFNQEGLEYVTFTLNADGTFADDMRVLSKDDPCEGCADTAADIVADMENKWYPAILDGKPVKTTLTIPVRFKLIN